MFKGTWDFMTASSKVLYDKTADYMGYYMSYQCNENEANPELQESEPETIQVAKDPRSEPVNNNENNLSESIIESYIDTIKYEEPDSIDNYNQFLRIDKYANEKDSRRILPEVGLYTEFSFFFSSPTPIVDNIYLGSAFNAASYDTLIEYNISVIINVTKEISNYFPDDFNYIKYDLYDNNEHSILEYLNDAYKKIKHHQHNTTGNILVHCYMGRSRSASVVIYYLMRSCYNDKGELYSFDEALEYVKNKRPIVNPTFRFTKDLAKSIMFNP